MNLINEKKMNTRVQKELRHDFDIEEDGLYMVEISARAKSWRQNTAKRVSFFRDDGLTLAIDGVSYPHASWNGNRLKNLQQVNVVFLELTSGTHRIDFFAHQSPFLETVRVFRVSDERNVALNPHVEYHIERGDRRPWVTYVFVDTALERVAVNARASKDGRDDDDVQIRIDGESQKNTAPKAHRHWYWCGKILKGQPTVFDRQVNLPVGVHSIELWTDNMPVVDNVHFVLGARELRARVVVYPDVNPVTKEVNMREKPDSTSVIITTIPIGAQVVIAKKGVAGEELFDKYLSDIWHEVVYQNKKGFVHSSLLEIVNQERKRIIEFIKTKAKELGIDEELALNLAHCESKWLPFAHSYTDNKGIYQLGKSTIEAINTEHGGNVVDPYDFNQNIDGGLRYFKYLLTRYKRSSDSLIRAMAAWNAGPSIVPVTGSFDLQEYDPKVKKLITCAMDERRGEKYMKLLAISALFLFVNIGSWAFFAGGGYKNLQEDEIFVASMNEMPIISLKYEKDFSVESPTRARGKEVFLGQLRTDLDGRGLQERVGFAFYSPEEFVYYTKLFMPDGQHIWITGSLWEAFVDDLTADGKPEIIVTVINGQMSTTHIFSYKNRTIEELPVLDENGQSALWGGFWTRLGIRFDDLDDDGKKEVILSTRDYSDRFVTPTFYYRWNGEGFMLYDSKEIPYNMPLNG